MLVLLLEAPVRTCVRIFQPGGGVQKKNEEFKLFHPTVEFSQDFHIKNV